jgi:hypothetical protein
LGIRDLCVHGSDVLILAGPTMELDGPVTVFRWPGATRVEAESVVFAGQLPVVLDVPYGKDEDRGKDHAEGMTPFGADGSSVLIVYDSIAKGRERGDNGVAADIFELPH